MEHTPRTADYHFPLQAFLQWRPDCENLTASLLKFLSEEYPEQWEVLCKHYADDHSQDSEGHSSPRQHLYGWEDLLREENFDELVRALDRMWPSLSGLDWGPCQSCRQETEISYQHKPIVSFELAPLFILREALEMDGSQYRPIMVCRKCAMQYMKKLAELVNEERITCWA